MKATCNTATGLGVNARLSLKIERDSFATDKSYKVWVTRAGISIFLASWPTKKAAKNYAKRVRKMMKVTSL